MARGYPDYNNPVYSLASKNIDFGILALAQMGIASIDGRGRIVWFENWREGIYKWSLNNAGDAFPPRLTTTRSFIAPASCEFVYGTLAGVGEVGITRETTLYSPGRLGVEFSLSMSNLNNDFRLYFRVGTLTEIMLALLTIHSSTGDVIIQDDITDRTITNVLGQLGVVTFIPVKLVVDFITHSFVRLMIGELSFDLSQYVTWDLMPVSREFVSVGFDVLATGAVYTSDFLGHVIFTTDEP